MTGKRKLKSYVSVGSRLLGEPYLHIREKGVEELFLKSGYTRAT
jgi:hypothetical protein